MLNLFTSILNWRRQAGDPMTWHKRARKRQQEEPKEKLWNALLSGYRSVRAFSEQDEAAVELFVIARRLWVMGLDVAFIHNVTGALDSQKTG